MGQKFSSQKAKRSKSFKKYLIFRPYDCNTHSFTEIFVNNSYSSNYGNLVDISNECDETIEIEAVDDLENSIEYNNDESIDLDFNIENLCNALRLDLTEREIIFEIIDLAFKDGSSGLIEKFTDPHTENVIPFSGEISEDKENIITNTNNHLIGNLNAVPSDTEKSCLAQQSFINEEQNNNNVLHNCQITSI